VGDRHAHDKVSCVREAIDVNSDDVPTAPTTHSVPSGQTPAQSGAAAEPHATTSGSQKHDDPAEFGRHA